MIQPYRIGFHLTQIGHKICLIVFMLWAKLKLRIQYRGFITVTKLI